jgi:MFS family permease
MSSDETAGPAPAASSDPDGDYPSPLLGWYVTGVLILAYMVSYLDRQMLTLMVDPIRQTFGISDLQISLLHGFAFAIFYTVLGLPMGRIADRYNRRNLIVGGIVFWSLMTSLCGVARSYGQMFLARVGVGVGESTLSPAAYSILSDYFPPEQRARVLSVYTSGIYLGAGLATFGGGALLSILSPATLPLLGAREPWQIVFLLLGLVGLPVALMLATVPEPKRRGLGKSTEHLTYRQVFAFMGRHRRAFVALIFGISAYSMVTNGLKGWIPTFLMREYGWSPAEVGVRFGLVLLVFGTTGTAAGGFMAVALRRKGHTDANLKVAMFAGAAMLPLGLAAPLMPGAGLALAVYAAVIFVAGIPFGVAASAVQEITPNRMRGQVSAVYLFGVNLAGIGTGPIVVAFFTDKVFGDDGALPYSLALLVAVGAPLSLALLGWGRKAYRAAMPAA